MSTLEALFLGILQGLTEFFPVSSSGHLAMVQSLLGLEGDGGLLFEIAVHVATLLAIAIFYRQRIIDLIGGVLSGSRQAFRYAGLLALGTVPAVVIGLLGKEIVETHLQRPLFVAGALLLTSVILWTTRWTLPLAHRQQVSVPMALGIGLGQAFAIIPGISRSGTTIAVALVMGLAPAVAAEYSFLLGIIAIAGAAVLMLPDLAGASPEMMSSLAIGSVASLFSGVAAIWLFVRMLEKQTFHLFSYYLWVTGGAFLVWALTR